MDLTGWRNAKRPAVPAPVQRRKSFASLRRPTDSLEEALTYNVDSPAKFRKLDASPSKNTTLVVFGEEAHDAPAAAPAAAPVAAPIEGEEANVAATMPAEDEEAITTLAPVDEGEPAPAEAEAGGEAVPAEDDAGGEAAAEAEAGGEPAPAVVEAEELAADEVLVQVDTQSSQGDAPYGGMVKCPNCGNIWDGNAQCMCE